MGPISTCANGGWWDSTIIGTVLDHLQPNQMIQIRSIVQKVTFGTFSATLGTFWAPSDPSGPNFHMREWWPMVLNHNRNRFRPFPAKSNDSNWIRSPKSMFLHFFSIFAKCQSQKGAKKNFEKFSCFFLLRMTQKFSIFFFFKNFKNPLRSGPF